MFKTPATLLTALLLASCALPGPQYATYETYNCRQLQQELELTNNAVNEREQKQVVGAALTMLGLPPGDGSENPYDRETMRLKDRADLLRHLLVRKDCYRYPPSPRHASAGRQLHPATFAQPAPLPCHPAA